jgi:outer membrane lipoprotein-sorting protein
MAVGILAIFSGCLGTIARSAQQLDLQSIIQHVDAAVQARIDNIVDYTATEHYAVFRNHDEVHPVAEMTVRAVYRKGQGKSYTTLSESGSALIRSQVLHSVLDNEKRLSLPGNVETALIDSANYVMELKPNQPQQLDGRDCLVLSLTPKRSSPYLFKGTLWVDANDYSILQLEGTATKSPFFLTGAAQVSRQYAGISGFPMAMHASAISNSALLGQTIVKIDYKDYQVNLGPAK